MSYKIDCLKCVESDWYHKWCSLNDYRLHDYVKGPLKFPMVTVPIPYEIKGKDKMDGCYCAQYMKECYSKPGIPDPWCEYLILRRENEKGKNVYSDFPKCDLDITRYLDQNYRVYLGQGIPDPWKKWTHIEPLEPSIDNLRKNWKSYIENLRIGPGYDMYDVDKVCCPNCDRRLLVLCLKKFNPAGKENEKEIANTDSVSKPIEEKLVEQKVNLKDAWVETDSRPETKNNEVQILKKCSCKSIKICSCNDNSLLCPVCNKPKNEERTERRICKKNDSCFNCKKNSPKNGYFYSAGPNCPMRIKHIRQHIPVTDQNDGLPSPILDFGHHGTILPFFFSSSDRCVCPAQQFIGFEEKNNHGLELQLICPKCERKRKKRRRTKCERRKEDRFPCHCRNNERTGFQEYTRERDYECDVCDSTCKVPHCKERIKSNASSNAEHRCQCYSKEANKTRILEDRDYVRLLEILGCTGLFFNKPDMNCDKSKTNQNKISSKSKRPSFSRPNHSCKEDNAFDTTGRGLCDWEKGWADLKYEKYEIGRHSTGTKNKFETVEKDSKCNNYKKPFPRRMPYISNYSVDEVRKTRSHLRNQKSRSAFRKELSYFLSNPRKNVLSNVSELSSENRLGKLSGESKKGSRGGRRTGIFFEGAENLSTG